MIGMSIGARQEKVEPPLNMVPDKFADSGISGRKRVMAYIDGFNVYYGLKNASRDADRLHVRNGGAVKDCLGRSLYWLDMQRVILDLLVADEQCVGIKYFSAPRKVPKRCPIRNKQRLIESNARQMTYFDALRTLPLIELRLGWYSEKSPYTCEACQHQTPRWEEKTTDVGIATSMVVDAYEDRFDTALVLSADADLVPPVQAVQARGREVIVAVFPGRTRADRLLALVKIKRVIEIADLRNRVLPEAIDRPGLRPLECPPHWRHQPDWAWDEADRPTAPDRPSPTDPSDANGTT